MFCSFWIGLRPFIGSIYQVITLRAMRAFVASILKTATTEITPLFFMIRQQLRSMVVLALGAT
jgi:hypothetical protein